MKILYVIWAHLLQCESKVTLFFCITKIWFQMNCPTKFYQAKQNQKDEQYQRNYEKEKGQK